MVKEFEEDSCKRLIKQVVGFILIIEIIKYFYGGIWGYLVFFLLLSFIPITILSFYFKQPPGLGWDLMEIKKGIYRNATENDYPNPPKWYAIFFEFVCVVFASVCIKILIFVLVGFYQNYMNYGTIWSQ